ncbi:hypothetical protein FPV67DRAFT_1198792 [Lyophyllum atratum]|nr:hypothetical protein FPV67DRAFT_1198792 [Lyophyllum atratum]
MMDDLASRFISPNGDEASAFSTAEVRANAGAYILSEIASYEAVLCLWKRRLNALALVSRLPPEFLGTIFKYVASGATKHSKLEWISVSHVCWSWRSAALDCPDLWCNINIPSTHPSWAAEMLQRSKMAPLTVAVVFHLHWNGERTSHLTAQAVNAVLSQVLTQMFRVKELTLSQSRYWSHSTFMELIELLDAPAPLLEKLDVSFGEYDDGNRLPDGLLASSYQLVHLQLFKCGITWQGLVLSNLKTLQIVYTPNAMHPTMNQLVAALSEMPSLEILVFRSIFAPPDVAHTASQTTATLPCLRFLQVESELRECTVLLDSLTYPKDMRVKVQCRVLNSDAQSASLRSLISRLAEILIDGIDGGIRALAVDRCRIRCWMSPQGVLDIPKILPRISVELDQFSTLADEFLDLLPVDRLSILTVYYTKLREATWLKFATLGQLKTLRVGPGNERAVLKTLSHGIPRFTEGKSGLEQPVVTNNPVFSALSDLTIMSWTPDSNHTRLFLQLAMCLKLRHDAGLRLHYLKLQDCPHVSPKYMDDFERNVDLVERDWYGYSGESDY